MSLLHSCLHCPSAASHDGYRPTAANYLQVDANMTSAVFARFALLATAAAPAFSQPKSIKPHRRSAPTRTSALWSLHPSTRRCRLSTTMRCAADVVVQPCCRVRIAKRCILRALAAGALCTPPCRAGPHWLLSRVTVCDDCGVAVIRCCCGCHAYFKPQPASCHASSARCAITGRLTICTVSETCCCPDGLCCAELRHARQLPRPPHVAQLQVRRSSWLALVWVQTPVANVPGCQPPRLRCVVLSSSCAPA